MASRVFGLFALAIAVAACNGKKEDEATPADSAVQSGGPAGIAADPPKGTLPAGWETYNSGQFTNAVAAIQWSSEVGGERKCSDPTKCSKTRAEIAANEDVMSITRGNGGPHGSVVAKMNLLGNYAAKMYGLKSKTATYYVVISATGTGNEMRWRVIQVEKDSAAPADSVAGGRFKDCGHEVGGQVRADWWGCDSRALASATTKADSVAIIAKVAASASGEGDGWISCASGCCTFSAQ